jgi:hypothetical protein
MALQQTGDLCMLALHPSGMEDLAKLQSELNEARLDFLHIDLDTAMTLAQIAGSSQPGSDKRARNLANARHAYDVVSAMRSKVPITPEEDQEILHKLDLLKTALVDLGETI